MLPKNIIVAAGWHQYKCAQRFDPDTVITIDINLQANADYNFNLCDTTGNLPHNYFDLIVVEYISMNEAGFISLKEDVPSLKNMLINIKKLLNKNGVLIYLGEASEQVPFLAKETGFTNTLLPDSRDGVIATIGNFNYSHIYFQLDPELVKYVFKKIKNGRSGLLYKSDQILQNSIDNFNKNLSNKIKKYEDEILYCSLYSSHIKLLRLIELYIFRAKNAIEEKDFYNAITDLEKAYKLNTEKILPYPTLWITSARILKILIKSYIELNNTDKANELFSLLVQLYEQNSDPFNIDPSVPDTYCDENSGLHHYENLTELSKLLGRSGDYEKFKFLQIIFTIYVIVENDHYPLSGEEISTKLNKGGYSLSDLYSFVEREYDLLVEKKTEENAWYIDKALETLTHIHDIALEFERSKTPVATEISTNLIDHGLQTKPLDNINDNHQTNDVFLDISSVQELTNLSEDKFISNDKSNVTHDALFNENRERKGEKRKLDPASLSLKENIDYSFFSQYTTHSLDPHEAKRSKNTNQTGGLAPVTSLD
ncbi:hypothetical protein [Legionella fairfieldensis]|uniref:hypothetical protein n=1 Tax=Legionella fairfieldensis TaxID=45064 RepID=UPI000491EA06|nr:hypothetical protein [Legionella fairfieldensis]